jgi:HEAT repeat protein
MMRVIVKAFARYTLLASCWLAAAARGAPPASLDGASWIWAAGKDSSPDRTVGTVCIRAGFAIPEETRVTSAHLLITADNVFEAHINGRFAGRSEADGTSWMHPQRIDVAGLLNAGWNVLAIEAANIAQGPAGLVAKFVADLDDGRQVVRASDGTWKCVEGAPANWEQADFNDQDWSAAVVLAEFGGAPWGRPAAPQEASPAGLGDVATDEKPPPGFAWPDAVAFVGDDCSLYRPASGTGASYDSLTVTTFNPRDSRAFPEHDLPAPMKVGRKLLALAPARPGATPRVLLDAGMGAIGSPSVTFDGRVILVSMVREGDAFFHIWRVTSDGGSAVQLTEGPFHDIDPAELPDGRIVFTSTRAGRFEEYHNSPSRALFTMDAEGNNVLPLTHTFIFDNEAEVLADGRVLFIRSDNFFDRGKVETLLHAVLPDGTRGQTEFGLDLGPGYGGRLRAFHCGSPAPMPDGRVAYVNASGIAVGRPGGPPSRMQNLRVEAGDVAALPDGRLLCTLPEKTSVASYRKGRTGAGHVTYERIAVVDPARPAAGPWLVYASPGAPLHSPVYLGPRVRPPELVQLSPQAGVPPGASGVLYCQDARRTRHTAAGWQHVRAVRVLAGRGLTQRSSHSYIVHAGSEVTDLGTVPLAPDGSFQVEVPADTAIAFQMVDAEGRSELNEMSWIYVRPGEQRGCVGCHAPRQTAPPTGRPMMLAAGAAPLRLMGGGDPHRFRGNNAAVTGLMELQFDRFREVAGINRHAPSAGDGTNALDALVARLSSASAPERQSAAQRLAIFRDPAAAPALAERLADESREVRAAAALALAACGTRESVPVLLGALADRDPWVAQAAAVAIGNLIGATNAFNGFAEVDARRRMAESWRANLAEETWAGVERRLLAELESGDRDRARRAAVGLSHVGGPTAREPLRAYVGREREVNPYPEWRKAHQGDGTQFSALDPANPRALQEVTRALGALCDADSLPMLAETAARFADHSSGNLFLSEAAVEAIGRIQDPAVEATLIHVFAGLTDYFQHAAWYGDHSALIACHASPTHYRILEALDARSCTNAAAIVPAIIRSVPTDPDRALLSGNDDYEALAGRLIRRSSLGPAVVETCLALLGDPVAAQDSAVAAALSAVHGAWAGTPTAENRAAQILSCVLRDPAQEPRVRAAFERYRSMGSDIPRVFDTGIPVVLKLPVKHWVCFYLARALGNLADPRSVDTLMASLSGQPAEAAAGRPDPLGPGHLFLHNDLTPCWRAETAWALGRIGDRRAAPALLAVLEQMENAPDTRFAAAEALRSLGEPSALVRMAELAADYPEVSIRDILLTAMPPVR